MLIRGGYLGVEFGDNWQPGLDATSPLLLEVTTTVARYLTHAGLPVFDGTKYLTSDGRPVYRAALTTRVGVSSDGEHVFGFTALAATFKSAWAVAANVAVQSGARTA